MQLSYNLLKEYVDIALTPEELAERLSMNGIVAERIKPVFEEVKGVVVGEITDIQAVGKSGNLSLCMVDLKSKKLEVICGAKNIRIGNLVPVVTEGGNLPGLGRIEGKEIQGVYSQGMICSAWELGLEKSKSPGVLILENNFPLGEDIKNIKDIAGDVIFDFEIFSNRPDLMSIIGIAREIAAFSGKPLHIPEQELIEIEELITDYISVEVEDKTLCPRYAGRIIKGLQVEESPFWLRWKLYLLGVRPINNIVDVTNYVMMETGQPLHAFDLSLINGKKIIIRRANPGEKFRTLDGIERVLTVDNLVIADTKRAIALAGVMGGENSEIKANTKDVFLESAYFDPINNRKTSSYLGLRTDASNRFEKGIDPYGQVFALNRAAYHIMKLTEGKVISGVIDQYSEELSRGKAIRLNLNKVDQVLGIKVGKTNKERKERVIDILSKLEFQINSPEEHFLEVTPPSFRSDIKIDVDIIEEIARIFGYENIPSTLFKATLVQEGKSDKQKAVDKIRNTLISCGMHQIISYSMINPKYFEWLKLPSSHHLCQAIELANPLIQEQTIMRTTLIPGLLKAMQWNVNHSIEQIKLFEIGRTYFPRNGAKEGPLPVEKLMITGGVAKIGRGDIWQKSERWDIFYLKGILEALFDSLGIQNVEYLPGDLPFFHPQQNGIITSEGKRIAVFGRVGDDIITYLDIPGNIFLFELDYEELYPFIKREIIFQPLPKYPHIQRDMAIIVAQEISFAQIKKEVLKISPGIKKRIELFDEFRGKQIKEGFKSIAFSIFFQSDERTLTDMEVDKIMENVTIKLKTLFQADLR